MLRVNAVESNRYFLEYLESKNEVAFSEMEALEWEAEMELDAKKSKEIIKEETVLELDEHIGIIVKIDDTNDDEIKQNMSIDDEITSMDVTEDGYVSEFDEIEGVVIPIDDDSRLSIEPIPVDSEGTMVCTPKKESIKIPPAAKKRFIIENCRLCLKQSKEYPEENSIQFLKSMIKKILTIKKFVDTANATVPNKLCDDCLGKFVIANDVADRTKSAYDYFHSKTSIIITTSTCWVCLKDFLNEKDICEMSSTTYSYFHYLACRNSSYEQELDGDKRICLKCMHDLEVTNTIRYKNWKTEQVLEMQFGVRSKALSEASKNDPWLEGSDDDQDDFTIRPLNYPPLKQQVGCQYCLEQFPNETKLRKHLDQEHVPGNTECEQCGLKLANERGARLHFLSVHMKITEALCDICGKTYHSMNKLNKHRVIHFEDRNVQCQLCPARFKRKENLKIHMRVHSGEKPFKCRYCDKKYAHHTDLKRHTFSHTGQFPFICKYCKEGFCKKQELKDHEDIHNPFDPNKKLNDKKMRENEEKNSVVVDE